MNKNVNSYIINPLNGSPLLHDDSFFETLLDDTCSRLHDMQVRHSIRRLGELETILNSLEVELDAMIPLATENEKGPE
ncbi:MAG: hypothetical protein LBI14_05850 [Treponema sp.]|jgi:hypothetical protein|nr:hypothetical protein [Treponema sp.]